VFIVLKRVRVVITVGAAEGLPISDSRARDSHLRRAQPSRAEPSGAWTTIANNTHLEYSTEAFCGQLFKLLRFTLRQQKQITGVLENIFQGRFCNSFLKKGFKSSYARILPISKDQYDSIRS